MCASEIPAGTILRCGCCGDDFQTWTGYVDQDQDLEYGICRMCQVGIGEHEEAEYDKLIACVRSGLKPAQLAKFDSKPREVQKYVSHKLLSDGAITITFGAQ